MSSSSNSPGLCSQTYHTCREPKPFAVTRKWQSSSFHVVENSNLSVLCSQTLDWNENTKFFPERKTVSPDSPLGIVAYFDEDCSAPVHYIDDEKL